MSYKLTILKRNIYVSTTRDSEKMRRHIIRKFKKAFRQTGIIFNKLNFEDAVIKEDRKGHIIALLVNINQKNSMVVTESSDSKEVLNSKVYLWNDFADAIINLF